MGQGTLCLGGLLLKQHNDSWLREVFYLERAWLLPLHPLVTGVQQQSVSLHIKRMCQLSIYFLLALNLPFFAQLSCSAAGACEHTSCREQCEALPREGTGGTPQEGGLLFLVPGCPHLVLVLHIPVLPETPRGSLTLLWLCQHHRVSVYQLLLPRNLVASFRVTSSDADRLWCATLQGSPLLPKGLLPSWLHWGLSLSLGEHFFTFALSN